VLRLGLNPCLGALLLILVALIPTTRSANAAQAEKPIQGGLGMEFSQPIADEHLGAETARVPGVDTDEPGVAGDALPWRQFLGAVLPRPFRSFQYDAYVMVDEFNKPMHALAIVDADDCAVHMEWLATTLAKKYDVEESAAANAKTPYSAALEIDALGREIRIQCGPHLRFDYLDAPAIDRWRERRNAAVEAEEREQSAIDRRRLVLERRRSLRFANQFTQGNQYRLEGAFGISFEQPFAEHSSKKFPVDEPFYVALPNLPEPFAACLRTSRSTHCATRSGPSMARPRKRPTGTSSIP
jgi:hypothetical protein